MTRLLTTFFGLGLLRPAPGTWGSLGALLLGMVLFKLSFWALLAATLAVTALGFWACRAALAPGQDPSEVVIDEVAGQWLTLLFPAAGFAFSTNGAAFLANGGAFPLPPSLWPAGLDAILSHGWMPWPAWVFPFALFRLFDIWKPGLIGRADAKATPASVMEDDLWAGLFAGIATVALAVLYHIPLVLMK
ncbi:phosphatidylglycerophosphatase A [Rhodobacter sp. KR11]|uniref:phosphatidylglycerophosphatase A family protein n=1 Tax=Rhodobacter sp. KR11 TaxID=2974588 RepID=UPI0022229283|nr:phosphatidylglycerophosphatase A [Rhodobacter sp. KR11]MCW1919386.1 phosphatidylglycerophosphatase A [Rhodobacter sp. KR11]